MNVVRRNHYIGGGKDRLKLSESAGGKNIGVEICELLLLRKNVHRPQQDASFQSHAGLKCGVTKNKWLETRQAGITGQYQMVEVAVEITQHRAISLN